MAEPTADEERKKQLTRRARLRLVSEKNENPMSLLRQVTVFVVFVWVVIPIFVFVLAWIFAAILSAIEDWDPKARALAVSRRAGLNSRRARDAGPPVRATTAARTARPHRAGRAWRPARRGPPARGRGRLRSRQPGTLRCIARALRRVPAALTRAPRAVAQQGFYYCISKLCGLTNPLADLFPAKPGVRLRTCQLHRVPTRRRCGPAGC